MVVLFHNFVSGEDSEYMKAFRKFVDFAVSKNATFVTTMDLVEMAKRNQPNDQNQPRPRIQKKIILMTASNLLAKAIHVFREMQGIELLQGDVWGHRKDLDEYFTI